jgi:hypothetical protein
MKSGARMRRAKTETGAPASFVIGSEQRPSSVNGRRFPKGQSGDPDARSKEIAEMMNRARQHTSKSINTRRRRRPKAARPVIKGYADRYSPALVPVVLKLRKLDMTTKEINDILGISYRTFWRWRAKYPAFLRASKTKRRGRRPQQVDNVTADSLGIRAGTRE